MKSETKVYQGDGKVVGNVVGRPALSPCDDGKVVGNEVGRPILSSCDDGKMVGNEVGRPTLTCDIVSSIDRILIRLM